MAFAAEKDAMIRSGEAAENVSRFPERYVMLRYDLIKKHIDKKGIGIEIGPSHNPIAPRKEGYNVHIIDHLDKAGLIAKYTGHNVNLENIEDVDFIWHGEKYADLVGATGYYDWIIASHVVEHTPDLVSFINDCDEILKESGVIILALPDASRCFDYFRPLTGIAKIVDAYLNRATRHSIGTAVEHLLNACTKGGQIAWNSSNKGPLAFIHSLDHARAALNRSADDSQYLDYHAWCFTPYSFRVMIEDLYSLGLITVREVHFLPTGGFEFFAVLGREGGGPGMERIEMLDKVRTEFCRKSTFLQQFIHTMKSLGKCFRG